MAAIIEDVYTCPILNEMLTEIDTETTLTGTSGYNINFEEIKVPGGIVNAMITLFLTDKIGIGVTPMGEIYTEVKGDSRDSVVAILYHPKTKKVQACKFNTADVTTKQALVTPDVNKTPFQIAIPFLVQQRIFDKFHLKMGFAEANRIVCFTKRLTDLEE